MNDKDTQLIAEAYKQVNEEFPTQEIENDFTTKLELLKNSIIKFYNHSEILIDEIEQTPEAADDIVGGEYWYDIKNYILRMPQLVKAIDKTIAASEKFKG